MALSLGNLIIHLSMDSKKMDQGLTNAHKRLKKFENITETIGQNMQSMGLKLSAMITLPLLGITAFSVKAAAEMELLQVSIGALLRDQRQAVDMMREISAFSAGTPFQIQDIGNSAKILLAFGRTQQQVMEDMQRLGDIAAASGKPIQELAKIFGKVIAKGRAQTEELNQLGERGIPILQELQATYGATALQIRKMAEDGLLTADIMEEAFRSMTSDGGIFFNMMELQSKTLFGVWSNLKDNTFLVAVEFGNLVSAAIDLKGIANSMISVMQKVASIFRGMSSGAKKILFAIVAIAAAIGPLIFLIGSLILIIKGLVIAILFVKAAMTLLLFNPIALAVAGIIALIAVIIVALVALGAAYVHAYGQGETFAQKMNDIFGQGVLSISHWLETIVQAWKLLEVELLNIITNITAAIDQFKIGIEIMALTVFDVLTLGADQEAFDQQMAELGFQSADREKKRKKELAMWQNLLKIETDPIKKKKKAETKDIPTAFAGLVKKFAGIAEIGGLDDFRLRNNLVPEETDKKNLEANEETAKNTDKIVAAAEKTNTLLEKHKTVCAGIQ